MGEKKNGREEEWESFQSVHPVVAISASVEPHVRSFCLHNVDGAAATHRTVPSDSRSRSHTRAHTLEGRGRDQVLALPVTARAHCQTCLLMNGLNGWLGKILYSRTPDSIL